MTRAQARTAFTRAFGVPAPRGLDALENLAPGDFAVAARRARILGERGAEALLAMFTKELATKAGGLKRKIGF